MATNFQEAGAKPKTQTALDYHSEGRPGKIEVIPSKPVATVRDLALAYTPGVAEPCLLIHKDEDLSYKYTARGNLVAVLSNGTAVLGLGDIGAAAGKPVMEGKGVLFKKFADIDVFDIEISPKEVDEIVRVVKALEPTFGGINLEDIKSPECFEVEERLKKEMNIPVFHDDQHGTAIISGAALINAAELAGKKLSDLKVVVSGAGASAIACTRFYLSLGVKRENVLLVDTKGVVFEGRKEGMNKYKAEFAATTSKRTLEQAFEGADVFLGCSAKGLVTPAMIRSMAKNPIVFALANPDPEIDYPTAKEARPDIIMATGRSDYPNQVNNVLGFPFIFRGALDVRARAINEEMKMAAARALAALAREDVPESVSRAYGGEHFVYGRDYIIPKPFDPRVLSWVAPAVAKAAMQTGVARNKIDEAEYVERLKKMQGRTVAVMRGVFHKARRKMTRIALTDATDPKTLAAAEVLVEEELCRPVLVGSRGEILAAAKKHSIQLNDRVEILDPHEHGEGGKLAMELWQSRQRAGMRKAEADRLAMVPGWFAALMLKMGKLDGVVTGLTESYPEAIRPGLQVVRTRKRLAAGTYLLVFKRDVKFLADCTVNMAPSAEELVDIAIQTAEMARSFDVTPRVAFLSYSNFGSARGPSAENARRAAELTRKARPDLEVDGEMQVDAAVVEDIRREQFPFSALTGDANVLIFPNLDAANIGYKLLWRLGGAEVVGPVLMGMNKPFTVLQRGSSVNDIVNLAAMTAIRAQGDEYNW